MLVLMNSSEDLERIPPLVCRLYEIVDELSEIFPGRSFTPDGHLVGSIGEALAAYMFDLTLMVASNSGFDARTADGLNVEIKATQGSSVALSAYADPLPDRLLVLRLTRSGRAELVYNGPATPVWARAGSPQKNGQRRVSVAALRQLLVDPEHQLTVVHELPG
jgi:hypothetical protein